MPLITNATELSNLFVPEVVAGLFRQKLVDNIRFTPLCRVDNTLVGSAGNTITVPTYDTYIGDAVDLPEGQDVTISQLTQTTGRATIKKVAKGVAFTDEALLSGYGNPLNEGILQLSVACAQKIDNDALATLGTLDASRTHTSANPFTVDDVADALTIFGEDMDESKVLLMSPEDYTILRKTKDWIPNTELGANMIMSGVVGQIYGCQVVVTNKLKGKKTSFIVKPETLALYMKRSALVEMDRDIINFSTIITASQHYTTYLYNPTKAVKIVTA